MHGTKWVVIDTETDGLYEPIHVVELAAQLMDGWEPIGEPFRMLLNHDVHIPREAVEIHGYTQEYLRKHGHLPHEVYCAFREYARDYPLVAHNLGYDWNRCLEPEWARLGIPKIGQKGFCSLMLARRLLPEADNYRLENLKDQFRITPRVSHQAKADVLTVVELFQNVYRQRLESACINTFEKVEAFTKKTPVAKCLALVSEAAKKPRIVDTLKDEWYYLDASGDDHGPATAKQATLSVGLEHFYVWREGMPDWKVNVECQEFIRLSKEVEQSHPANQLIGKNKTVEELIGLCRGLVADERITTAEVMYLHSWLQDIGFVNVWPATEIVQTVEKILEDGVVKMREKAELKALIERVVSS